VAAAELRQAASEGAAPWAEGPYYLPLGGDRPV